MKDFEIHAKYRSLRNKITGEKSRHKKELFSKQIEESTSQMWEILKLAQNKCYKTGSSTQIRPDIFHNHFTTVGLKIVHVFNKELPCWAQAKCIHTFTFNEVTLNTELKNLQNISNLDNTGINVKL